MENIRKILFLLSIACICSCTSDEQFQEIVNVKESTKVTAILPDWKLENENSRTSITTGAYPTPPSPVWVTGDSIGIYPNEGGDQLSFRINEGGSKTCTFDGGGWAMKSSSYTAYSPFRRSYYYKNKENLPISMLGQTQNGNDNADHLGAYDIQIAKGDKPDTGNLIFKFNRYVALVRLEITAPKATRWTSISLDSDASFTTEAKMNLALPIPTITSITTSNSVTLNLKKVSTTDENPSIIAYMMLLPVDLTEKTLSVKLTDVDGNVYISNGTITNNKTIFAANSARWITADSFTLKTQGIPYLTFTANEQQSLSISKPVSSLEYSVNYQEWKELGTTTVDFGGSKGNLRLRGKSSFGTAEGILGSDYAKISFGKDTKVACQGDIRTLVDYENYTKASMNNASFAHLFEDCICLTSAPSLPATTLKSHCYSSMFKGCTSLTETPKLPAEKLAWSCYSSMFEGCTSLTTASELPAESLASECYSSMFKGCTNLTSAPELPAETLAYCCYSQMFSGCSSLKNAPELPASELTTCCYLSMFSNCISLTSAPELPSMVLENSCYSSMFSGCSNLQNAPELPAEIMFPNCYEYMFKDCTSLTNAPKLSAESLERYCYRAMFSGCTNLKRTPVLPAVETVMGCYESMFADCTNLTSAPKLPATTAAQVCYAYMFSRCTNLTSAPDLPATTLVNSCYEGMFENCIRLTTAPNLPATSLVESCYLGMFKECTSLTTTPQLPAEELARSCYSSMFEGCTSITTAPELPAETLTDYCYYKMFNGCSKLNNITMMATSHKWTSLDNWVEGVASTGTFTKAKEMTSLPDGHDGIPEGWIVKDKEVTINGNIENPTEGNESEW